MFDHTGRLIIFEIENTCPVSKDKLAKYEVLFRDIYDDTFVLMELRIVNRYGTGEHTLLTTEQCL